MRHAPSGIDLSRVWIDEFRPGLMDGVPVFPKLFPFQLAGVFRWRSDLLRAPLARADGVPDVALRDVGVCSARSYRGVGVDFRRANSTGLGWRPLRKEDTD